MNKRCVILITTLILLLAVTIPTFADYVCGYCWAPCTFEKYGQSSTLTSSEPCVHYSNGKDVTYYHYDYYQWKCTDCGHTFGQKTLYRFEKMVCNGY